MNERPVNHGASKERRCANVDANRAVVIPRRPPCSAVSWRGAFCPVVANRGGVLIVLPRGSDQGVPMAGHGCAAVRGGRAVRSHDTRRHPSFCRSTSPNFPTPGLDLSGDRLVTSVERRAGISFARGRERPPIARPSGRRSRSWAVTPDHLNRSADELRIVDRKPSVRKGRSVFQSRSNAVTG